MSERPPRGNPRRPFCFQVGLRPETGLINRDDAAAAERDLHDPVAARVHKPVRAEDGPEWIGRAERVGDRKSTRLNSSHLVISYAVFCLKKKKIQSIDA